MTRNDWLTDKRIVRRNIEQGKLDAAEYDKLLESLPDLSDKVWRRPEGGAAVVQTLRRSIAPAQTPAARPFDYLAAPLGTSASATGPAALGASSAAGDDLDDDDDDDIDDDDDDDDIDDDADDEGDDEAESDDADDAVVASDKPVLAAPIAADDQDDDLDAAPETDAEDERIAET